MQLAIDVKRVMIGVMNVVYFMQQGTTGPIKIGHTANLAQRFTALRVGSPHLRILAVLVGGNEDQLHEHFDAFNIEGEWFHPVKELLAFIELLPKEMPGRSDPIISEEDGHGSRWDPPIVICPKCSGSHLHIDDVRVDIHNEIRIHLWCETCEGEPVARAPVGWLTLSPHEGAVHVEWKLSSNSK
jgi:hypothetical protein